MKKRCILFVAAMMLLFHAATGCQKTEQGENTQRLPESVAEAASDSEPVPNPESAPNAESAPTPEVSGEPNGSDSDKKSDKYILGVTVEGEDF